MIQNIHPRFGSCFLPISDPGSRGKKVTGSRIRNHGLQMTKTQNVPIVPYGKYNRVSAIVYLKEKCKKDLLSLTHVHIKRLLYSILVLYDETHQSEME
jgi:hypothetical protein